MEKISSNTNQINKSNNTDSPLSFNCLYYKTQNKNKNLSCFFISEKHTIHYENFLLKSYENVRKVNFNLEFLKFLPNYMSIRHELPQCDEAYSFL